MRSSLITAVLALTIGVCGAQTPTSPDPTPTADQLATAAADQAAAAAALQAEARLAAITANTGVPSACVSEILDSGGDRTLGFNANQLCPIYLILSSKQYQRAAKAARNQVVGTLWRDPAFLMGLENAYKTLSQQEGSSSGTSGSTSLASKGAASQFLSLASEYGALAQSTSGDTTTVTGSLAGLPLVLLKRGIIESCPTDVYGIFGANTGCLDPKLVDNLAKISYSVSFDTSTNSQSISASASGTSNGSATPAVFQSAPSHSISAVSVKWIAIQGKPAAPDLQAAATQVQTTGVPAKGHALAQEFQLLEVSSPTFLGWHAEKVKSLRTLKATASPTQLVAAWKLLADEFVTNLGIPENFDTNDKAKMKTLTDAAAFAVVYAETLGQEEAVSATIARPAILSFEYDENRPASQPTNSVFRGIYQAKVGAFTLTANGAFSIYDSQPSSAIAGASRLRDVQFAFEADHDFSIKTSVTGKVGMTGSGSFYFQDQTSPAILNVTPGAPVDGVTFVGLPATATQVYAEQGKIAIGQLKATVGTGSNLKVPFSVTYSNRTELVTHPTWKAQIGISYDLDSLFKPAK